MSQDILNSLIIQAQKETVEGVQNLIEEKGIKQKMLSEAQNYAQAAANHLTDESYPEPQTFEGINLNEDPNDPNATAQFEYYLVLDYLESIGLKFAPTVFRYESQNPTLLSDRSNLGSNFRLPSYDRTPILVQLIERLRKYKEGQ